KKALLAYQTGGDPRNMRIAPLIGLRSSPFALRSSFRIRILPYFSVFSLLTSVFVAVPRYDTLKKILCQTNPFESLTEWLDRTFFPGKQRFPPCLDVTLPSYAVDRRSALRESAQSADSLFALPTTYFDFSLVAR